ncbi:hypothetical protein AGMMS49525_01550 [Bacteroidia bacterium]|nr:hypothetical protein AGMMS49525_01550 [Bacteroidia bacterium]
MKNIRIIYIITVSLLLAGIAPVSAQYFVSSVAPKDAYVRFAVISDTHFGNSQGEGPLVKVPKALQNITSYGPLDAIFVVGDLTDGGSAGQYTQFVNCFGNAANYTNPVAQKIYMMGNHDNYAAQSNYVTGLKPLNDNKDYPFDQYIVIKGYPFITISQRNSSNTDASTESNGTGAYPQAVRDTLDRWMARAAAECQGKPIFVFTHVPPKYTCYSSWPGEGDGTSWPTWSMKVLNPILNKYPQAVVFGGHSHFPIGDPRSIHQGVNPNSDKKNFFTGINTGSTTYSEIHKPSVDIGIHPENYAYVTEGLILTAQPGGDIKVQRYDTYRKEEIDPAHPWVLKAPHDGSQFQYADKRDAADNNSTYNLPLRDGLPAPVFASTATVTLGTPATNSITVTFPQATDNECVFRYRVQIKKADGTVAKEFFKFSQFYLNSQMPTTLSATLDGLRSNTTYTAEVTAYDSYENTSTTLVSAPFTTAVDNNPANQPPAPTALWEFNNTADLLAPTTGTAPLVPVRDNSGVNQAVVNIATAGITSVTGPSASNGAIKVPKAYGLRLDHGSASPVTTYTLAYDIKVPLTDSYYALLFTHNNSGDGDFFIKKEGSAGLSVTGFGYTTAGAIKANTWHRVVFVVTNSVATVYIDGSLGKAATDANSRWNLQANSAWLFSDDGTEDGDIEVAGISYWNSALTGTQISNLGEI